MRKPRSSSPGRRLAGALGLVAVIAATATGATLAAFTSATSTPTNSFSASPDWFPPNVDYTILGESQGGSTYDSEVLADGPLGYWRLGERSGTTAFDSSGNARDGTYLGGYTLGSGGVLPSSNTSVTFNNSDARVEITSSAFELTNGFTVEAWVRPVQNNKNDAIWDKTVGGATDTSYTLTLRGGKPRCRVSRGGNTTEAASGTNVTKNAWTFVVCTYDGSNVRLYQNKVLKATRAVASPIDTGSGVNVIGRLGDGTQPMNGRIDEVAVYGTALSAARITAHYNAASGTITDYVRQCRSYYMYANITDSGSPPSGVASAEADLSSITSGKTNAALEPGSFNLGNIDYNWRIGPLIADGAPGSPTYSITSTDELANANTQTGFVATVNAAAQPTPVFLTGLEQGVASTTAPGVFDTVVGTGVSADSAVKRNGSYSLKVDAANLATHADVDFPTSGDQRHPVIRFALRLAAIPPSTVELFSFVTSGRDGELVFDGATGKLGVRFEGQTIVPASSLLSAGTWYVIDLKGDFQANPHSVNWRIDGDLQPATTYSEGGKNVTSLVFGTGSTVEFFTANYDDIYASQTVANYPLGDGKVLALRPNTMGTSNGSGNFQDDDGTAIDATTYTRVGEVPASSTSDYVKQTANSGTSYVEVGFENPAEICIDGVGARIAFHSPSAAGNDGEVRVLDGTTSTVVYNGDMGQTSLGYARAVVTPASTWSQSAVSGLVARLGYSGDTSPNPYFDSVLLEYDMPTPQ